MKRVAWPHLLATMVMVFAAVFPGPGAAFDAAEGAAQVDGQACAVVYGDDWALMAVVPPGWHAVCGAEAMPGTVATLWPDGQSAEQPHALIYVTVNGKGGQTLDAFIAREQAIYRKGDTRVSRPVVGPVRRISSSRRSIHISNASGGRDELVVYVEGPTAFFIIVLTADSPAHEAEFQGAFERYLASFSPARVEFRQGDKAGAKK